MSRRRFAGWEPATVTSYEYDERGRLVSSRTVPESEWSDEDRAWAAALAVVEARCCPGCRRPASEVYGSEDDVVRWSASHIWCGACLAGQGHASAVMQERPEMPREALRVITTPRDG